MNYANFARTAWTGCALQSSSLREAVCSEVRFKNVTLAEVNFSGAEFFKTPLAGLDVSNCDINGILVSESFRELRGLRVSALQAMELARLLGVRIL